MYFTAYIACTVRWRADQKLSGWVRVRGVAGQRARDGGGDGEHGTISFVVMLEAVCITIWRSALVGESEGETIVSPRCTYWQRGEMSRDG